MVLTMPRSDCDHMVVHLIDQAIRILKKKVQESLERGLVHAYMTRSEKLQELLEFRANYVDDLFLTI